MEEILKHTPIWVFFILIALLYLGYIQSKTRTVTIRRAIVIPIAMTALSLIWHRISIRRQYFWFFQLACRRDSCPINKQRTAPTWRG